VVSDIPKKCLEQDVILGIDEAGRGPVLGPMTYAAAYWATEDDEVMKSKGFQDSKTMTKESRKAIYDNMKQTAELGFVVRVLHASEISRNMLRKTPYNLNAMSHDAAMEMIWAVLDAGVKLKQVYIDTVGIAESYKAKLDRVFQGKGITFTVEKKADSKFATCSGASILAKVTRDDLTDKWSFSEGKFYSPAHDDYGSGYPSDPKCKEWLKKNVQDQVFCFPDFVRFSWGPAKIATQEEGVKVQWEADDEDEDDVQQLKVSDFMMAGKKSKKRPRTEYFERRGLSIVTDFGCSD